jgi:hypothetical protein
VEKDSLFLTKGSYKLESSWNVMVHGDAREGKWRGNWRMEWVASTLHTTSAASNRLNWSTRRFKWTRPFRRNTKSGFCACAVTFQTQSTTFVTNINCVPSYSIFSFTTNLLTLKSNFDQVYGNFSPRKVLLNLFIHFFFRVAFQQLSSLHSHAWLWYECPPTGKIACILESVRT